MKNCWKEWKEAHNDLIFMVTILAITIIVTALLFLLVRNDEKKSERRWSNGICSGCNIGHYELIQAVGHRTTTTYIYECDNCGHKTESSILK